MASGDRSSGTPGRISQGHDVAGAAAEVVLLVLQVTVVLVLQVVVLVWVVVVADTFAVVVGGGGGGRRCGYVGLVVGVQTWDAAALAAVANAMQ